MIPTYNRATVLPRALASVLAQTCTEFEVIVVVDGSTDETAELLRQVEDPRVRWIVQPNAGQSAARNTGIDLALGEWLAFLDDDNEWHPAYLERQLATAARTGAPVVYAQALEPGETAPRIEPHALPEGPVLGWLTRRWGPFISAVMVRRSLAVALGGFSTALSSQEDSEFLLRLGLRVPFGATPEPLMTRHRPEGVRISENFAVHGWHAFVRDADTETRLAALRALSAHNESWRADHLVIGDALRDRADGRLPAAPAAAVHVALSGSTVVTVLP